MFTRRQIKTPAVGIAANAVYEMTVNCDWWEVRKCHKVSDSTDVEIELAVDGYEYAIVEKSDFGQEPNPSGDGKGSIKILRFKNTNASAVFVHVLYGLGIRPNAARTTINNATLTLSAAQLALLQPPRGALTGDKVPVVNASTNFVTDARFISIWNNHATQSCRYRFGAGAWRTIVAGEVVTYPVVTEGKYGAFDVDATTLGAGSAEVQTVYQA